MLKRYLLIAMFSSGLTTMIFAQAREEPIGKRTAVIISKIDDSLVSEFQKAWLLSSSGLDKAEALVLLYQMPDGSITARSLGRSGLSRRFSFRWTANVLAVVHTHPNGDNPKPVGQDLLLADRFGIPIFTITQLGMYVYDPDTRKTSRVQERLDWLSLTKWRHDRQQIAQR